MRSVFGLIDDRGSSKKKSVMDMRYKACQQLFSHFARGRIVGFGAHIPVLFPVKIVNPTGD
jgi:hypothetical protein